MLLERGIRGLILREEGRGVDLLDHSGDPRTGACSSQVRDVRLTDRGRRSRDRDVRDPVLRDAVRCIKRRGRRRCRRRALPVNDRARTDGEVLVHAEDHGVDPGVRRAVFRDRDRLSCGTLEPFPADDRAAGIDGQDHPGGREDLKEGRSRAAGCREDAVRHDVLVGVVHLLR